MTEKNASLSDKQIEELLEMITPLEIHAGIAVHELGNPMNDEWVKNLPEPIRQIHLKRAKSVHAKLCFIQGRLLDAFLLKPKSQ